MTQDKRRDDRIDELASALHRTNYDAYRPYEKKQCCNGMLWDNATEHTKKRYRLMASVALAREKKMLEEHEQYVSSLIQDERNKREILEEEVKKGMKQAFINEQLRNERKKMLEEIENPLKAYRLEYIEILDWYRDATKRKMHKCVDEALATINKYKDTV